MKLALRRDAPTNATLVQRITCWGIKARLASQYCHGGIVIDGRLYHATAQRGLHVMGSAEWTPAKWDIFDTGGDDDRALSLFRQYESAGYDWASLSAFVGVPIRDKARMYCFEWCYLAITAKMPKTRVTPEVIFTGSFQNAAGAT